MRFFLNKSTSICCGISCIRVIEVWCSIGRRIVANCEVDGTLEEKRTEIQRSCHFLMEGFSRSVELTPILCPLSLTRAKFLDGSDLTWPVARSRRGTLADPRNLTGEKHNNFFFWSHSLFYEVMRTWKILKSYHNTKLPVYLKFILPFTLHCNQTYPVSIIASTSWRVLSHHCDQWSDSGGQNHGRHITSHWITKHKQMQCVQVQQRHKRGTTLVATHQPTNPACSGKQRHLVSRRTVNTVSKLPASDITHDVKLMAFHL